MNTPAAFAFRFLLERSARLSAFFRFGFCEAALMFCVCGCHAMRRQRCCAVSVDATRCRRRLRRSAISPRHLLLLNFRLATLNNFRRHSHFAIDYWLRRQPPAIANIFFEYFIITRRQMPLMIASATLIAISQIAYEATFAEH